MEKATRDIRIAQWTALVEACQSRPSGMTIKQWLADNNINEKSYYYRQKIVRRKMIEAGNISIPVTAATAPAPAVSFAEIPASNDLIEDDHDFKPDAVIRSNGTIFAISNTISDRLLSVIMMEVSHAR